jgi:uncharacterized membrane protein YbhN (UPF0104 family)
VTLTTTSTERGTPAATRAEDGKDWWFWWRLAVGVGLLVALLILVGPDQVLATVGRVRTGWALAVAGLSLVWLCLGALNVWILLRRLAPVSLSGFLGVWVTSWATSLVIPGQLGDATQVVLLRRWRVDMSRSGAAYLVDKAISLAWMLIVASWAVALYVPSVRGWWFLLAPAAVLAVLAGGWYLIRRRPLLEVRFLARLQRFAANLRTQTLSLWQWPGTLTLNAVLTVVKWMAMAVVYLLAFRAFGATVSPMAAATIPIVASLVGYIPVTLGGAGTMEWTAVALFGSLGVDAPTVVVVYLFIRALLMAAALLLLLVTSGGPPSQEVEPYAS